MAQKKSSPDSQKPPSTPPRRGGKPPSVLQQTLGWYRDAGYDLTPWWESESQGGGQKTESPLYRKMDKDHGLRLEGKGGGHRSTEDLHAAFFWEALRRHPDSQNLRKLKEQISDDFDLEQSKNPDPRISLNDEIILTYDHGVLDALETLACFSKLTYPRFASEDDVKPWLGGYRSLWKIIDKKGHLPAAIPPTFTGSSSLEPHGSACMHLIRKRQPSCLLGLNEVMLPQAWSYESPAARGIPLESFAEAEDESGTLIPPPSLEEVMLTGRMGDQDRYDLVGSSVADRAAKTDLRIHLRQLRSELRSHELEPLLLAVNLDAPTDLIVKQFRSIIASIKKARPTSRKIRWESFQALSNLDRAVLETSTEATISSEVAKNFDGATQINASAFFGWCNEWLEARKARAK